MQLHEKPKVIKKLINKVNIKAKRKNPRHKKLGSFEERVIYTAHKLDNFHKKIYVVAGAKWGNLESIKTNKSNVKPEIMERNFDPRLKNVLNKLGQLGTKPKGSPNYIGNCAEQNACNNILKRNQQIEIGEIVYTLAYRPRTCQIVPYCSNCTKALNVKN